MSILSYKGFTAKIEVDLKAHILKGRVLDSRDAVKFQGQTVEEIKQAFQDLIDNYLKACAEVGKNPAKSFSGKLNLRTTFERYQLIEIAAKKSGKSINAWMDEVLTQEAKQIININ
jgi:predicted HicB family RNase H-like nuclease